METRTNNLLVLIYPHIQIFSNCNFFGFVGYAPVSGHRVTCTIELLESPRFDIVAIFLIGSELIAFFQRKNAR